MRNLSANFWRLFGADLIVRTAYQIGKTPLLPIFAAAIGAGELVIGLIVAVSTCTGMVLKPVFGALSDRWGRRLWLLLGLAVFTVAPFLYQFVETPEQLFALRLIHGTATAIFGPVTLAYIAELGDEGRATRMGWFGMAREGGYLIAPLIAGLLLTVMQPETVFTIIGLISSLAILPVLMMGFGEGKTAARQEWSIIRQLREGFVHAAGRAEVWFAGLLEMGVYIVTYALKAFLPIYILQETELGVLVAGAFFTVQEAAHLLARPGGGWVGDRIGYLSSVAIGMALISVALFILPFGVTAYALIAVALISGVGQGLIFPSTIALIAGAVSRDHTGLGMGFFGTLRNIGKVAGPVIGGVLLELFSFSILFQILAAIILSGAVIVALGQRYWSRAAAQKT